jgi:ubiquinone/menaquinone biosynthesis C-methylase UbiE
MTDTRDPARGWDRVAGQWLAWARTPGHDAYWHYREAFFALLPPPPALTLEVGCGEGRVTRDLRERGYATLGLDASPRLVEAAAEVDPDGHYVVSRAEALPLDDDAFDLAVAYNSRMDVDDLEAAVSEMARVLRPDGVLAACVTHPMSDARGSYLDPALVDEEIERGGLTMRFVSRHYPLQSYASALVSAGLVIEAIREPRGPGEWARFPMFLMLRARHG